MADHPNGSPRWRQQRLLLDLRGQLGRLSAAPPLPAPWQLQVASRAAAGDLFGGDFVVSQRTRAGRILDLVVIDVAGRGLLAGTRSLMLAGAVAGLLGAVEPPRLLPAVNDYLLRQDWTDGLATACYVHLELATGNYRIYNAGHPPPAHRHTGNARWSTERTHGPALGVTDGVAWPGGDGRLAAGDTLLLYTDGLVERPGRDLDEGLALLLDQTERLLHSGVEQVVMRLMATARGRLDDDRTAALLRRGDPPSPSELIDLTSSELDRAPIAVTTDAEV